MRKGVNRRMSQKKVMHYLIDVTMVLLSVLGIILVQDYKTDMETPMEKYTYSSYAYDKIVYYDIEPIEQGEVLEFDTRGELLADYTRRLEGKMGELHGKYNGIVGNSGPYDLLVKLHNNHEYGRQIEIEDLTIVTKGTPLYVFYDAVKEDPDILVDKGYSSIINPHVMWYILSGGQVLMGLIIANSLYSLIRVTGLIVPKSFKEIRYDMRGNFNRRRKK